MLENLTEKLTGIMGRLTSRGRLTEKDIDDAMGQVRRSLLEADVNFRVARDFVAAVKERAHGVRTSWRALHPASRWLRSSMKN